ncbi:hypothetical protein BOTBODRAFT_548821 [Botryobasidium botryosum FD-172 SS1]|uniref:Uncharacterized protein n=1 Tax=Botryobasidium botryosum (strain FD-172 SS1) TaxID=930990 RepID=A0A067MR52_BOTB1|nr:hypothetical protein BOTBODRAFT_548821 [Botryobasidium botryosum FD-172 SS1]
MSRQLPASPRRTASSPTPTTSATRRRTISSSSTLPTRPSSTTPSRRRSIGWMCRMRRRRRNTRRSRRSSRRSRTRSCRSSMVLAGRVRREDSLEAHPAVSRALVGRKDLARALLSRRSTKVVF